jgi:endo-1,4-beta-D-glucanase Y
MLVNDPAEVAKESFTRPTQTAPTQTADVGDSNSAPSAILPPSSAPSPSSTTKKPTSTTSSSPGSTSTTTTTVVVPAAESYVRPYLLKSYLHFKAEHVTNDQYLEYDSYECPASDGSGGISWGAHSEGQGYILGMALYSGDQATFTKIADWTLRNMKRPTDHLLGWSWAGGHQCVDNAPDGDIDFSYYLLKGGQKWGLTKYVDAAKLMIADLWRVNVEKVGDKYYMNGGGKNRDFVMVDPSYQNKWSYEQFALVDTANAAGWRSLAASVVDTIDKCTALHPLKLPPDWCFVSRAGDIYLRDNESPFGHDAYRVFWKMALLARKGDAGAIAYLKKYHSLTDSFNSKAIIPMQCPLNSRTLADCGSQTMFLSYLASVVAAPRSTVEPNANGTDEKTWFLKNFINRTYVKNGVTQKAWMEYKDAATGETRGTFRDPGTDIAWGNPENRYFLPVLWLSLTNLDPTYSLDFGATPSK